MSMATSLSVASTASSIVRKACVCGCEDDALGDTRLDEQFQPTSDGLQGRLFCILQFQMLRTDQECDLLDLGALGQCSCQLLPRRRCFIEISGIDDQRDPTKRYEVELCHTVATRCPVHPGLNLREDLLVFGERVTEEVGALDSHVHADVVV